MSDYLKRYSSSLLCALLLIFTLSYPIHLIATEKKPSQEEPTQSVEDTTKDDEQSDEQEEKKPTFAESWRKVLTLRWKELSKADVWNIGVPFAGVASLGLMASFYSPKNANANNNHYNPDQDPYDYAFSFPDLKMYELPQEIQREIALHKLNYCAYQLEILSRWAPSILDHKKPKHKPFDTDEMKKLSVWNKQREVARFLWPEVKTLFFHTDIEIEKLKKINTPYNRNLVLLMKNNLTIPQVRLISIICQYIGFTGESFTIYHLSEDGKVFLTFDKDVRMLLLKIFDLELKLGKAPADHFSSLNS